MPNERGESRDQVTFIHRHLLPKQKTSSVFVCGGRSVTDKVPFTKALAFPFTRYKSAKVMWFYICFMRRVYWR